MATFPSGTCTAPSTWKNVGGIWVPVVPPRSFTADCTAPLHFVLDGDAFLVKPADFQQNREYQNVIAASAITIIPGLDVFFVNALDAKFPGAKKDVPGHPGEFTLPMVPIGGPPIDIT